MDQAGGLAFRLNDAKNITSRGTNAGEEYSCLEVVAGRRRNLTGANFEVTSGVWHECGSSAVENKIIC